ncbi:unnamed protein product [Haemonchus placei]|uniref:Uncharacterized protein n=1 Tax=Haemonchus placei TaxID=6290 RepID=A0A0N4WRU2_HAEPC|nr:unnamed protein product [Haemonchus placei]
MFPRRASSLRERGSDEPTSRFRSDTPRLAPIRTTYIANKFSPLTRQIVTYRGKNPAPSRASLKTPSAAQSQTVTEMDMPFPRLVEETSTSRAACSSGIVRFPISAAQQGGRYLLRIPKNDMYLLTEKIASNFSHLQIWLEQLRETHAIEFVVSSGSKKWGQGLQVHYLTCSRSGEQKERPNKKFRRPTRPSIKCGKNCMAYLKMKQNPTVSELKIEACLHHSGHEIDASKIRLERNEWCRVIQLIREIDEGLLQIDLQHMTRIREILGNNGRFRLMTDEGLCQQLPKWIEQYSPQEELELSEVNLEPEIEIEEDSLLSGYNANMSLEPNLLLDAFQNYAMECLPYDFMSDLEPKSNIAVKG